ARHEQPGPMVRTAREGRTPGMDDPRHHDPHPSHVVMVTGSRSFIDSDAALRGLNAIWAMWGEVTSPLLISGTARGADRLAESLFARAQLPIHRFPADWNTHGRAAGFRRNVAMIDALEDHRRRGAEVIVLALALPCTPCPHRNPSPHITHGTEHARSQARPRQHPRYRTRPITGESPWTAHPHHAAVDGYPSRPTRRVLSTRRQPCPAPHPASPTRRAPAVIRSQRPGPPRRPAPAPSKPPTS